MKRVVMLCAMIAVGMFVISGCDVFPIPPNDMDTRTEVMPTPSDTGYNPGAGGTGVGATSTSGVAAPTTGTSTRGLGTGDTGPIAVPGPAQSGR